MLISTDETGARCVGAAVHGTIIRTMTRTSIPLRKPLLAAFLAWLIPGLGHLYQGRIAKGILYATCILGLYFAGLVMGEGKIVYWRWVNPLQNPEKFNLYYVGQFFVGLPALPALIQSTLLYRGFDPVFWGFMAEPAQNAINGLHPRLGKLVEVGTIYTTIAGLLNILAIYDAYEGPADSDTEPEEPATDHAQVEAGASLAGLKAEGRA
jgi:TM2 domain-containing membrane protein YozV